MGKEVMDENDDILFYRIKGCGGVGRPPPQKKKQQPFSNGKRSQGKLYIILKGIYKRFRISLNNCETTNFRNFVSDLASWSQKLRSGEIGKNFNVLCP